MSRLFYASASSVGIGTTTPRATFDIATTDATILPVGTTAQRPSGVAGMIRFNTTTTSFEGHNGSYWTGIGGGTIQNLLTITDSATINSAFISGTSTFNGAIRINNTLTITGAVTLSSLNISGNSTISGPTIINNTLTITGDGTLSSLNVSGNSTISGTTIINNNLTVTGHGTLSSINISGNSTISGATVINNTLTITGSGTMNSLNVSGNTIITGTTTINNSLTATGTATLNILRVTGSSTFNNTLFINGSASTSAGLLINTGYVGIGTSIPRSSLDIATTDATILPVGTTDQRPSGIAGMIRFNTTTTSFEGHNGSSWSSLAGGVNSTSTIQSILTITNTATINSILISGSSTLNGSTIINNTLTITGAGTMNSLNISTNSIITGASTFNNTLTIAGSTSTGAGLILQTGRLGIGTTTPSNNLDVIGALSINNSNVATNTHSINITTLSNLGIQLNANQNAPGVNTGLYLNCINTSLSSNVRTNSSSITLINGAGNRNLQFFNNSSNLTSSDSIYGFLNSTGNYIMSMLNNGNIGIGTTNPQVNFHLIGNNVDIRCQSNSSVNSENSQITSIQTSSNTGSYSLFRSAKNSASGYQDWYWQLDSTGNYQLVQAALNGTYSYTSRLFVNSTGRIGINSNSPSYPLHVSGSVNTGTISAFAGYGTQYGWNNYTSNWDVSIYSTNSIMTSQAFVSLSDQRMKENIQDIDDSNALDKLRLIKPKTYNYIDKVIKGGATVYGFIAQDVKNVLPYATSKITEVIPSIMTMATVLSINETDITLHLTGGNHLLSMDDKVKLIFEDSSMELSNVLSIINDNSFTIPINNKLKINDEVFVYGKQVDDFLTIDKNAIFTIGIGAMQQLDSIIQNQQTNINNLQSELSDLKTLLQNKNII